MSQAEDSYGRIKRQRFIEGTLVGASSRTVLDFGCGTGTQLTRPLAENLPGIGFLGVDTDHATIQWAREHSARPNLRFLLAEELTRESRFDAIIASEVLEHIETPLAFLRDLRDRLADNGVLIVTVPNGYGPFEVMALVETLLTLCRILPFLRRVKSLLRRAPQNTSSEPMTLAASPHINFFLRREVEDLLSAAGFHTLRFRSRTVFCGFIFDWLIRGPLIRWNAELGDRLPAWCASDWMFVCHKASSPLRSNSAWRRGPVGRLRRYLSELRWRQPIDTATAQTPCF